MATIPVPAPSSNEMIPSNSDDVNILCNTKSDNASSALHTCKEGRKEREKCENRTVKHKKGEETKTLFTCKPTLGIDDVMLCWILTL